MLCALPLIACGDSEPLRGDHGSGTRLRARYLVDADGARWFQGWFDRQRGEDCTWSPGDAPRCLPASTVATRFRDAQCTQPVDLVPAFCPPPTFLRTTHDVCAGAVDALWRVAAEPVTLDEVYDWNATTGACTVSPWPTGQYLVGEARVPLDQFVGGTVVNTGSGRIRTQVVVGDDGSLEPRGPFDDNLGAACDDTDDDRCWPVAAYTHYYEDDTCQRPIALGTDACPPPRYVDVDHRRLFAVGAAFPPGPIDAYDGAGTCTRSGGLPTPGTTAYHTASELSVDDLQPVAIETSRGGGRLHRIERVTGGHRTLVGFQDGLLRRSCVPRQLGPGRWACLPELDGPGQYFSDAACRMPLDVVFQYDGVDVPVVVWSDDLACVPRTAHVHGRGVELATYYTRNPEVGCVALHPSDGVRAFAMGPEIASPFATFTELVE